ncbi:SET domain-containing protein [Mytilinidion resinicola]|uniref:SET domain-containing protein n=1 Tax=Mytilinidion resinicola TaxID=574789 RepID=A0A6A6YYC6_9PEZI|nr:SET domain-containing protein [Mytilinidion resinicola]KAF2813770.1 SET domain-containing protein [Mytilinidion resinicola]
MSQDHSYRCLEVPGDAPFALGPSKGKGWGAFATRRIERGTLILREKPLFVIQKAHDEITEQDIWTAFHQLQPKEKKQFLCLRDNDSRPFLRIIDAFAENSFSISAHPPTRGIFLLQSRFDHSCIPNSKIPATGGQSISRFATRTIDAGEEITFCYPTAFHCKTRDERHRELRFICHCKACLPGTPFQQLSDMRRTLIRGLQYLTLGHDFNGQRQTSASPIIFNSELKQAAEDFSIPISSRLIYNLLFMVLMEEEGLLDDFIIRRMTPSIRMTTTKFQTESNVRIARLAMAQETWLGKFCVAFMLHGRRDVADDAIAEQLRMLHGLSV